MAPVIAPLSPPPAAARVSPPRRRWIASGPRSPFALAAAAVASLSLASAGCASREGSNDEIATPLVKVCPSVYGGVVDDDSESIDAVVEIDVGDARDPKLCTGALIAPNVVLTARHCVSITPSKDLDCHADGSSDEEHGQVTDDVAPADIHVTVGPRADDGAAFADGAYVYRQGGANLCNGDVALIVLDHTLDGVKPLRIGGAPKVGASIRVTGYGKNDLGCSLGTRIRKDAVKVLAIGPGTAPSGIELGSHEFDVQRSFCDGDSGGPAIDEATGEILGVVSHGRDCAKDGGHVYTSLGGLTDLVGRALRDGAARAETERTEATELGPLH